MQKLFFSLKDEDLRLWNIDNQAHQDTLKEIASDLSMSYQTADTHIRRIYEKLHVHTRSGAVAKAFKDRLI